MAVAVDEAGNDDHAGAVDDAGVDRTDIASHLGNALAVQQYVAATKIADLRVHRDDRRVPDQSPLHVVAPEPAASPVAAARTEAKG